MAISSLTIIGFCGTNITGIFTFNFQPAFIARNWNPKWRKFWQAVSFANLWCDLYCIIKKQKNLKQICDVVSKRVWNHNFKLQIKMVTTFFRVLIFHTSSKSKSHKFTVCLSDDRSTDARRDDNARDPLKNLETVNYVLFNNTGKWKMSNL